MDNEILQKIKNVIGIEGLIKLAQIAGGKQIYIPKEDWLFRNEIKNNIVTEYNGSNQKYLASKYKLSLKSIARYLKGDLVKMYLKFISKEDLKSPYKEIAEKIGLEETFKLSEKLEGTKVNFPLDSKKYSQNYTFLIPKIGKDNYKLLYEIFKGKEIYFHNFKKSLDLKLKEIIKHEHQNGVPSKELAETFGYSERYINLICQNKIKSKDERNTEKMELIEYAKQRGIEENLTDNAIQIVIKFLNISSKECIDKSILDLKNAIEESTNKRLLEIRKENLRQYAIKRLLKNQLPIEIIDSVIGKSEEEINIKIRNIKEEIEQIYRGM